MPQASQSKDMDGPGIDDLLNSTLSWGKEALIDIHSQESPLSMYYISRQGFDREFDKKESDRASESSTLEILLELFPLNPTSWCVNVLDSFPRT